MRPVRGFLLILALAVPSAHAATQGDVVAKYVYDSYLDLLLDANPVDLDATTSNLPPQWGAYSVTLSSVNALSGALIGIRVTTGQTALGTLVSSTRFKRAALTAFTSGDPCRAAASAYNDAISSGAFGGGPGPYQQITPLASLGCKARLVFDAQTLNIRAFQPVP